MNGRVLSPRQGLKVLGTVVERVAVDVVDDVPARCRPVDQSGALAPDVRFGDLDPNSRGVGPVVPLPYSLTADGEDVVRLLATPELRGRSATSALRRWLECHVGLGRTRHRAVVDVAKFGWLTHEPSAADGAGSRHAPGPARRRTERILSPWAHLRLRSAELLRAGEALKVDHRRHTESLPSTGTGTTLAVAALHGRNAIGIDIDSRNADMYDARYQEVKRSLFGTTPELPGQEALW